jgi:hypothetical protein
MFHRAIEIRFIQGPFWMVKRQVHMYSVPTKCLDQDSATNLEWELLEEAGLSGRIGSKVA